MFLIYFLGFTLIFTVFENISLAGISFILVVIFLVIYQLVSGKKIFTKKMMWSLVGGFVVAMVAWGVKEWGYYDYSNPPSFPSDFAEDKPHLSRGTLVNTGIIGDISSQGKYVFEFQGEEYLLYSKKEYVIGDHVWLVGSIQNNMHPDGFSYRKISASTFAVPIFS
jgi:hypothetical protein